jgi:hypothetical protein
MKRPDVRVRSSTVRRIAPTAGGAFPCERSLRSKCTRTVCALCVAVLLAGCTSVDQTDPSHFTNVSIRNDTHQPVAVVQCDTSCQVLHERTTIDSGHEATVNVSNEGITVGYAVERPSGLKLGCLYMRFNGVHETPIVNVTSLRRCR